MESIASRLRELDGAALDEPLLVKLNSGAAPDPESLGDTNCDGPVDVLDVTTLIDFVFRSGSPPCDPLNP